MLWIIVLVDGFAPADGGVEDRTMSCVTLCQRTEFELGPDGQKKRDLEGDNDGEKGVLLATPKNKTQVVSLTFPTCTETSISKTTNKKHSKKPKSTERTKDSKPRTVLVRPLKPKSRTHKMPIQRPGNGTISQSPVVSCQPAANTWHQQRQPPLF